MNLQPSTCNHPRSGIALIIVLGLLAILVLLGVAFSISSRTERVASRSYLDAVKARQLVQTALNRVIGEELAAMTDQVYPPWDVYVSGTNASASNVVQLLDEISWSFIPAALTNEVAGQGAADWITLIDDEGRIAGEYAFLVVNCSGLLDANSVGGAPVRGSGYDPSEISLFGNTNTPAIAAWTNYRSAFGYYETYPELKRILATNQPGLGPAPALASNDLFHVFSRTPLGYAASNLVANTNVVYIGGDPDGWDTNAILGVLGDFPEIPDKAAFLRVMQDYASTGYVFAGSTDSQKFERISSKAVPMIAGINVKSLLNYYTWGLSKRLGHRVTFEIVTWISPQAMAGSNDYQIAIGSGADGPRVIHHDSTYYQIDPAFLPYVTVNPVDRIIRPNSAGWATNVFEYEARHPVFVNQNYYLITFANPFLPPTQIANISFELSILLTNSMGVTRSGGDVDKTWMAVSKVLVEHSGRFGSLMNNPTPVMQSWYVNDPRINWSSAHFTNIQWGITNRDEHGFIHAHHGPFQSAGELGYLLYSATNPWTTVRLGPPYPANYPTNLIKLFDRFIVHPPNAYPRHGLVNPNTRQREALAAVFAGVPLDRYPGEGRGRMTNQLALAESLLASNRTYANLSDFMAAFPANPVPGASTNKFIRESVMRNSMGLFSPRSQLYTVVVAGRTYADGYDPDNPKMLVEKDRYVSAESRAVTVVWRDAYASSTNGNHTTAIQYFQWLLEP